MLVAFTPLSLLDLLARDEWGMAIRRPARLLGARWLSVRNGIAGRKSHIDGGIVLSLFRVFFAHGEVPFGCDHNREHWLRFRHQIGNPNLAGTFSPAPT
jgi:hypothetical protein